MSGPVRCSVCGETDPRPASLCLYRMDREARLRAEQTKRCGYSLEGKARLRAYMEALAAPSPLTHGDRG